MSALLGWFENRVGGTPPEKVLESMAEARELARGKGVSVHDGAGTAMAIEALAGEGDLVSNDNVWVAIIGRPHWKQLELSALASTEGHAAALRQAYRRHSLDLFACLQGSFA